MDLTKPSKHRVPLPASSSLALLSTRFSSVLISKKPSTLFLFQQTCIDEAPFDANSEQEEAIKDYQESKRLDLGVGNLILLKELDFESEEGFLAVSNDKAIVFLDKELNEVFRNEELIGEEDLCFFTSADVRVNLDGYFQGNGLSS